MKETGSGIRARDPAPTADVATWMAIEAELRSAFIQAHGSTPKRLLAVARILIQLATRLHNVDGGPRFTRTR